MGIFDRFRSKNHRMFGGVDSIQINDKRPRVLFVSHEATRTGAPKIILNVLKHFAEHTNTRLDTILHNGGHLVDEFVKYSHVDCLNLPRKQSDDLSRRVQRIVTRNRATAPVVALCNSMESRYIAAELKQQKIAIIFLIHELPSSYTEAEYQSVFEIADKVVFPIESVKQQTEIKIKLPEKRVVVLSQGLLNPEFGQRLDRDKTRLEIRKELGIPEQARIVLGCGSLDLRKGIDHFAAVARETILNEPDPGKQPIHFVWIGEGPRWTHSTFHYVGLDLEKYQINHRVHFVGERENVEPYFVAADVFLLSSRVDPLPCVMHEAMAAQIPVIAFDRSGGAAEAIKDGAGIVVPYGDYHQAALMISMLHEQPWLAASIRETSLDRVHTQFQFADYANELVKLSELISGVALTDDKDRSHLKFAA